MNWAELFITLGIMVVATIIYFVVRKVISYVVDHDDRWKGEKVRKDRKNWGYWKLNCTYALVMMLLLLYIIKLFLNM